MPCYDKKLEASRDDFFDAELKVRDVELVLTTNELKDLINEMCDEQKGDALSNGNIVALAPQPLPVPMEVSSGSDLHNSSPRSRRRSSDVHSSSPRRRRSRSCASFARAFSSVEEGVLDWTWNTNEEQTCLFRPIDRGASGGYLENVFRYAARALFDVEVADIEYKVGRNADLKEATLTVNGEVVLHFATAYGFRNIQNIIRKVKQGKCPYQYVEVMACPSGCLNGGGQMKAEGIKEQKALISALDLAYHSNPVQLLGSLLTKELYEQWVRGLPGSAEAARLLHTQYHAVQKFVANPLGIKW